MMRITNCNHYGRSIEGPCPDCERINDILDCEDENKRLRDAAHAAEKREQDTLRQRDKLVKAVVEILAQRHCINREIAITKAIKLAEDILKEVTEERKYKREAAMSGDGKRYNIQAGVVMGVEKCIAACHEPPWISVEERLPERLKAVCTYSPGWYGRPGDYSIAMRDRDGDGWHDAYGHWFGVPSHWFPLPDPPETGG